MARGKGKRYPKARVPKFKGRLNRRVKRSYASAAIARVNPRLARLERMIETKEGSIQTGNDIGFAHNDIRVLVNSTGAEFNPLFTANGTGDPMAANSGFRIGDRVTVRGLMIKGMFELALGRSKVHLKMWLVKKSRGDALTRATFFKQDTDNKMLDQINTERYTIVASRYFTISAANPGASSVALNGEPVASGSVGGQGSKIIKMWVPGRKFGRGGNVTYEDGASVPKFFDYRLVVLAYDWYGTPQDINNVARGNEVFTKLYFKDA